MTGWQPKETAPKDGTMLLVAGGNEMTTVRWEGNMWRLVVVHGWDPDPEWSEDEWTHWMPAPQPPEAT